MRCDERIVVSGQKEHVAVLQINVRLFYIDGDGQVDERIVADFDIILEVEGPQGRHVGIGIILREIVYCEAGV